MKIKNIKPVMEAPARRNLVVLGMIKSNISGQLHADRRAKQNKSKCRSKVDSGKEGW